MPKVSVIIPFYNVEEYIEQCLNSVLSQTLQDLEVILVNDASTDNTLSIVKKYAASDSRIKIIELNERKGQGYARNRAIEIATGEYIGFVDSDDFVKPEMYEKLYNTAKSSDNDITMCQAVEYDDVTGRYIESEYYSLELLSMFKDNVFSPKDTKEFILDINVALWNKIYKRDYLEKIGEKFPEGYIFEDLPFFFGTYLPAQKVQIVWEPFYVYRIRVKNSTMQQVNKKLLDRPAMVSLTYDKIKKAEYLKEMKQRFQAWVIDDLFHRYTLLKDFYQKEYFFMMKKIFEGLEIENIEENYWKTVYHFQGYLYVVNNTFEMFNQQVFNHYLDIHQMEVRLRSQVMDRDELQKNYAYTTTIFEQLRDTVNELKENGIQANSSKVVVQNVYENAYQDIKDLSFIINDMKISMDSQISGFNEQLKKMQDLIQNVNSEFARYKEKSEVQMQKYQKEIRLLKEQINSAERIDDD